MNEKEKLLQEINALLSYGEEKDFIDVSLLEYLKLDALENIKKSLIDKTSDLKEEDKEWLEQFKKYS
ncbi:MAG: hypothetical protein JXQ68_04925 [Campylobacterales bacterium]|nr:hypothetical protein [Campylobacterales bacterium]